MTNPPRARLEAIAKRLGHDRQMGRETRQGFGSGALKVRGKIFAMVSADESFVVKLPRARVDELVAQGMGRRFVPAPGRLMKEWLSMTTESTKPSWLDLAREAMAFVGKTQSRRAAR